MVPDLSSFAKAISDETRQKLMKLICCREVCVGDLVEEMGDISQPTVSHHLQVLRAAGLVDARREGKQVFYTLRQQTIADCCIVLSEEYAPEIVVFPCEPEDGA